MCLEADPAHTRAPGTNDKRHSCGQGVAELGGALEQDTDWPMPTAATPNLHHHDFLLKHDSKHLRPARLRCRSNPAVAHGEFQNIPKRKGAEHRNTSKIWAAWFSVSVKPKQSLRTAANTVSFQFSTFWWKSPQNHDLFVFFFPITFYMEHTQSVVVLLQKVKHKKFQTKLNFRASWAFDHSSPFADCNIATRWRIAGVLSTSNPLLAISTHNPGVSLSTAGHFKGNKPKQNIRAEYEARLRYTRSQPGFWARQCA